MTQWNMIRDLTNVSEINTAVVEYFEKFSISARKIKYGSVPLDSVFHLKRYV